MRKSISLRGLLSNDTLPIEFYLACEDKTALYLSGRIEKVEDNVYFSAYHTVNDYEFCSLSNAIQFRFFSVKKESHYFQYIMSLRAVF